MNSGKLAEQIKTEFGVDYSEAQKIAEKSVKFADHIQSSQEDWEGPSEIDPDYIISRLNMAPNHLSVTGKWNWWAGIQQFLYGVDYKI